MKAMKHTRSMKDNKVMKTSLLEMLIIWL